MKTSKFYLKCLLVMFLSVTAFGDDDKVSNSPSSTITMAELRDHMYFLASDELGGRIWNKPGYELALKYAASQFRAAGIVPILKGENGKPTYLQKVELIEKGYSAKTAWTFQTSAEIKNIKAGTGFRCSQPGHMLNGEEKKFYFAGYGISEPDHGWDDLKDLDLDGRIAVIMMGTPKKNGKEILPENIVKKYSGLRGIGPRFNNLKKFGASSIILLADDELTKLWKNVFDSLSSTAVQLKQKKTKEEETKKKVDVFSAVIDKENGKLLFEGQEYNPYKTPENLDEGYKLFPIKGASLKLDATRDDKSLHTWNVVGVIPGKHQTLKDEYISLGAHLDHIPPLKGEICNGADDNASGSIGVIESAEALATKSNKRSILFCLWSAEEIGLFGSRYFVRNSPVDINTIKAHINLDMIARTDKENIENRAINALGTTSAAPAFKKFIEETNTKSVNWPLSFSDKRIGVAGSDHMPFMNRGIPSLFFFSGHHKDYHRPTDDPENLDWEKFLNVSRLACDLVDELANTEIDLESLKKPHEKENKQGTE